MQIFCRLYNGRSCFGYIIQLSVILNDKENQLSFFLSIKCSSRRLAQKSNCAIPTKNQKLFLMFHVFVRYLYIFDERNNDMKIYKTAKEKRR